MASRVVTALLVFVVLTVGKAGAAVPRPPSDQCGAVCDFECLYGNVLDENGCPTCQCLDTEPLCQTLSCVRPCENGYVHENGCHTCMCLPDPPVYE